MKLRYHFSDFIYQERKKRKWTQAEIVKATGLTRATLSQMENNGGNITMENMEKLLVGMGLTLRQFNDFIDKNSFKEPYEN